MSKYRTWKKTIDAFFAGDYQATNPQGNVYAISKEDDFNKNAPCKAIKEIATLYSYGSHYPMVMRVMIGGEVVDILNGNSNSVTTNKHRGYCRSSCDYELPELQRGVIGGLKALKAEISKMINNKPNFRASWKFVEYEEQIHDKTKKVDKLENLLCVNCDDKIMTCRLSVSY